MKWETVIGLEVHVQLSTQSKIFSGAIAKFNNKPNTNICAIDLGMPGTLPVLNENVIAMAIRFGLALGAEINDISIFERKHYFYPDLPKGYQTSQMTQPIIGPCKINLELDNCENKIVRINHIHIEEDAGKSIHNYIGGMSGIDFNRAGIPLVEIVSEADMHSHKEALAYLHAIYNIINYIGISDCNMAKGAMRCDINISIRPIGTKKLGTRTEIKNVNSFRFVERAIIVEVERQINILNKGNKILRETRIFNPEKDKTEALRTKEQTNDYRYFPCPDLLPLKISKNYIDLQKKFIPQLSNVRKEYFIKNLGISEYMAKFLSLSRDKADYFECVYKICGDANLAANWIQCNLTAKLNSYNLCIKDSPISAYKLGGLLLRIKDKTITNKAAKDVFTDLWTHPFKNADQIINSKCFLQVNDENIIKNTINKIISENNIQVDEYINSNDKKRKKMFGFFIGKIMKRSNSNINPQKANVLLKKKLDDLYLIKNIKFKCL
ncbi:Aspartyl/glutamyl-tRNA(Asn/Gln) amidotransferase subunit B [Candidatus Johnevansia muelleri]|uniref:Aspartyl/glutamyl-tRNA(Asn/Gln) amidotransferase subunit B n=1 Tax=Candidatus Johnevansia muelleri TaxID=1495769 RepID=A0A078KEX5_9GAMM|nr:Aspartyl/glutamyl-tRNA(Asn/Gln) amidotransferase subunit B [Candidatus Evansia muelleri]